MASKIRLYVECDLGSDERVLMRREQAHYVFNVMRCKPSDTLLLFNGRDGEWQAKVVENTKSSGQLLCDHRTRSQEFPPDLWLLFAPVKGSRTDLIVEKATEMGVARIVPVKTSFTIVKRVRHARLVAHAIEAAEQCGGTFVPVIEELQSLDSVLSQWSVERNIMFCDESEANRKRSLDRMRRGPWAILIGPEGGFSESERKCIQSAFYCNTVSLGPRILRADTAVVASLTIWQKAFGDWR